MTVALQPDHNRTQIRKQAGQLVERGINDRTIVFDRHTDHLHNIVAKSKIVERAGQGQAPHDSFAHLRFRRNNNVDRNIFPIEKTILPFAGQVMPVAHTRNGFGHVEQRFGDLTCHHIHLVAGSHRDENIGVRCAGFLKRFGIGAMTLNGPDVERVTDALHQRGGAVDNNYVDPLPRKMLGNTLPHLAGPTDNDFHIRSLNPVQAWLLA